MWRDSFRLLLRDAYLVHSNSVKVAERMDAFQLRFSLESFFALTVHK